MLRKIMYLVAGAVCLLTQPSFGGERTTPSPRDDDDPPASTQLASAQQLQHLQSKTQIASAQQLQHLQSKTQIAPATDGPQAVNEEAAEHRGRFRRFFHRIGYGGYYGYP